MRIKDETSLDNSDRTGHRFTEPVNEVGAADFTVYLALDEEVDLGVGDAGDRQ